MSRALVIEDQNLMCSTLIEVVHEHFPAYMVLGASTLAMALRLLESAPFDLVMIDPGLPGADPLNASGRIGLVQAVVDASPGAAHIVLTGNDTAKEAEMLRVLGVQAYSSKTGLTRSRLHELLASIRPNAYSVRLAETVSDRADVSVRQLSLRERQVLELMLVRRTADTRRSVYDRMASIYGVDPASAERYFKSAIRKLRAGGINVRDI
jgi:DNA-binding NarL/FixJ family response regulator